MAEFPANGFVMIRVKAEQTPAHSHAVFDGISARVFVLNPDSEVSHDLNPGDKQFSYVIPVGGPGTTGISCGS